MATTSHQICLQDQRRGDIVGDSVSLTRRCGCFQALSHAIGDSVEIERCVILVATPHNMFSTTDLKGQTTSIRIAGFDAPEEGQSNSHPDHVPNK